MVLVVSAEILARLTDFVLFHGLAWLGLVAVIALARRMLGLREAYLLVLSATLTGLVWMTRPDPLADLTAALDQASFLMSFILLLGLLHEAASTSPSVAACGEYLTRQPPGRRYYALSIGTGLVGVLFNLGVVSFLVPLIQKGIERATPNDALNPIRERRQVSALLRGFGWSVIWSPTALAPLALAQLIPGTDRPRWILYGLGIYALITLIGALEDAWRFRAYRPSGKRATPVFPAGAALRFLAAALWLFGMSEIVVLLTGQGLVAGLMMACPLMMAGWLAVQFGFPRAGALAATARRIGTIVAHGLPKSAPVAITLACSGYIGRAGAALVPAPELAQWLQLDAMPDFVLLSAIPLVLSLISLLALSPIMMAVFFGSLFGSLPQMPADPTLIALSISCGWGLAMTFSPFATVVLLIDRVAAIPARRLTWGWNLAFTILSALALVPIFALLTGGH